MNHASPDIIVKGTLLGNYAVGKSSLFQRYMFDSITYCPTIGVDFQSKTHRVRHHDIKLQLWDTAGQERFRSIVKAYVRNVYVFFLVFDVTRRDTFDALGEWLAFISEHNTRGYLVVLLANKTDQPIDTWTVTPDEVDAYVESHPRVNGGVYYVSARKTAATPSTDTRRAPDAVPVTATHTSPLSTPPTPTAPRTTPIHNVFVRTLEHIYDRLDTIDRQEGGGIVDRRVVVYRRHDTARAVGTPPERVSVNTPSGGGGVISYFRFNSSSPRQRGKRGFCCT